MSDLAMGRTAGAGTGGGALFGVRTLALLLALGILAFLGMLVLGAYAPDLRSGRNGGAHALSNAATGYSGLTALMRATGGDPAILRDAHEFGAPDLLVVTPENGSTDITAALENRAEKPTLFILPKWQTMADPAHRGWVSKVGLVPLFEPVGVLAPAQRFAMRQSKGGNGMLVTDKALPATIRFATPRPVQVITGMVTEPGRMQNLAYRAAHTLQPLITDDRGGMVLAKIDGPAPVYVLADPDLFNNMGMKDIHQAASALALLAWINGGSLNHIAFDVSFNGLGHSRSPLKLMFEPPFVAMTLTIAAALLLAGIQAFGRFGPVRARARAIAFGKAALVDNSAALVRKAGREAQMGGRYAAVIRERAARAFGAPARLRDGALDHYLDALKGSHRFTDLAGAAEAAGDRHSLLDAAQALHAWKGEKFR